MDLTARCKTEAKLPADTALTAFGACMSGFFALKPQTELINLFKERNNAFSAHYYIDNDSPGSIFTAAGNAGGCVIICGTGTMAQLLTADGRSISCGGHGHMYGDEGSAYFIASNAIRHVFRTNDHYVEDHTSLLHDITLVKQAMFEYFQMNDMDGMLVVMYDEFKKSRIAGFTRKLAELARANDPFAKWLFHSAGNQLGSMARTLAVDMLPDNTPSGQRYVDNFAIVCVGSVWNSWDLLAPSFIKAATAPFHYLPQRVVGQGQSTHGASYSTNDERGALRTFRLLRLKETSAVGAAWKAAAQVGMSIPIDFSAMAEVMYEHK